MGQSHFWEVKALSGVGDLGPGPSFLWASPLEYQGGKGASSFPSKSDSMSVEIGNQEVLAFRGTEQGQAPPQSY